jgi:hypothetical protein
MLDKIDKIWIGAVIGAIFPSFCFFCYWLFAYSQLSFPTGFIRYLRGGEMFQEVAIVCVAANLIVFYLLLNKKAYDISRGIIYATFGYVAAVLYISLLA